MNKHASLFVAPVILAVLLSTGCTNQPVSTSQYLGNIATPMDIISQESQTALRQQQALKAITEERVKQLDIQKMSLDKDVLSVDFIGKPEPLLESLCLKFGYRFITSGHVRDLPVINFHNQELTGMDIVKSVGDAIDRQASITLNLDNKTMTLHYL